MISRSIFIAGLVVSSLVGCRSQSNESQIAPSTSAVTAMSDDAIDQSPIPVKEDFEDQARQAINEENLDDQIGQLEKEIQADR